MPGIQRGTRCEQRARDVPLREDDDDSLAALECCTMCKPSVLSLSIVSLVRERERESLAGACGESERVETSKSPARSRDRRHSKVSPTQRTLYLLLACRPCHSHTSTSASKPDHSAARGASIPLHPVEYTEGVACIAARLPVPRPAVSARRKSPNTSRAPSSI